MGHEGTNHSGFKHVCGACQDRCSYFMPDNVTPVPICSKCWAKLNPVQKMMLIAEFKQARELGTISSVLQEAVRHSDILQARTRSNEGN